MPKLTAYSYICPIGNEDCTYISDVHNLTTFPESKCNSINPHTNLGTINITKKYLISIGSSTVLDNDMESIDCNCYESYIIEVSEGTSSIPNRKILFPDPTAFDDWIFIKTSSNPALNTSLILENRQGFTFEENSSRNLTLVQDGRYYIFCKSPNNVNQWKRFSIFSPFPHPQINEVYNMDTSYSKVTDLDNHVGGVPRPAAGDNYMSSVQTATISSSKTTWETFIVLNIPQTGLIPPGAYRIELMCLCSNSNSNGSIYLRLRLNPSTFIGGVSTHTRIRSSLELLPLYINDIISLDRGCYTFEGQISQAPSSVGTLNVRWSRLSIWRVA